MTDNEPRIDEEELARWTARAKAKPTEVSEDDAANWNLGHTNVEKAKKLNEDPEFAANLNLRDRLRQIAGLPIGNVKVEAPKSQPKSKG